MRTVLLLGAGFPTIWDGKVTSEVTEHMHDIIKQEWTEPYQTAHERLSKKMINSDRQNFERYIDEIEFILNKLPTEKAKSDYFPVFEKIIISVTDSVYQSNTDPNPPSRQPGNLKSFGEALFYPSMARELFDNYVNVIAESLNYGGPTDPQVNNDLKKMIHELSGENLGIYSLNYDLLISKLLKEELEIFDGFELEIIGGEKNWIPNPRRIVTSNDKIKYFNLHGSLQFIDGFRIRHKHEFHLSERYEWPSFEIIYPETGKFYLPIVTGGNKLFKTLVSPMKYFFSAFMQDLSKCDLLVIIGYSFSDQHINELIVDLVPKDKKLLIVDHADGNNYDNKLEEINCALRPWKESVPDGGNPLYEDKGSNCFCYLEGARRFLADFRNIINGYL